TICYAVAKLQLCYLFEESGKALEAARLGRAIVHHLEGTIWPVIFEFWNGLTLAASYADAGEDDRERYLAEMEKARKSFAIRAESCRENYLCRSLLLSAELERVMGHDLSAVELYERAVSYAEETNSVQHQALANELCARFYVSRGQKKTASVFLAEARACYAQWGAAAKVEALDRKRLVRLVSSHPVREGLDGSSPTLADSRATDTAGELDHFSVMKAAQAIASEIELEKLLTKLMRIAIENAGAERGSLILEREGESFVHAEGSLDGAEVKLQDALPLDQAQSLP